MTNVKMSMNPFCEIAVEVGSKALYLQSNPSCYRCLRLNDSIQTECRKLSDYERRNLQKRFWLSAWARKPVRCEGIHCANKVCCLPTPRHSSHMHLEMSAY